MAMKDYRQDVRAQMVAFGRDPDSCKVLFMAYPILADTEAAAREKADMRAVLAARNIEERMAQIGWTTNIDFSTHDLDAPVAELTTNGHQSSLQNFIRKAGGKTLREAVIAHSSAGGSVDLVGTPDSVAAQMGDIMEEVGGDGFLFALPQREPQERGGNHGRAGAGAAAARPGPQAVQPHAVPRQPAGILTARTG